MTHIYSVISDGVETVLPSKKVGVVVRVITINGLPEDLSPFTKWEVDLFQWKEHREDGDLVHSKYRCIEYDIFE